MRTVEFYAAGETAESYRWFAAEAQPTCPAWGALCSWIADTAAALELLDELPPQKRQPNLFLGAVRYLDGPIAPGPDFLAWMRERWSELAEVVRTHATQTNEAGRCAVLRPFLAALPQPLALLEVGMSAGLCLFPDRYGYRYRSGLAEVVVGADVTGARVDCEVPPPDLAKVAGAAIDVVWRAGIDLLPLDPRSPKDARWLRSLIWPGQPEREE
ncbi:MAG: DUF2332 family protein, partial [Ornithinimicrobium sp.]|uniref:DUF2332 family protein n=1 Tax=Ornithinimicrobium sp. TaxID=1977084 RepID=UPI0026E0DD08